MDETRWLSAVELARLVRAGRISPVEAVDQAIARVEELDPHYHAVVVPLLERARLRAAELGPGAPLAGVPMLLKDAGEELAGTPHWVGTGGLRAAGHRSAGTTPLAARFEDLGLVVVGKSACPELSSSSTTEPAGFAPTRNPWDVTRTVGGSSGGSAAAVAAGIVPLAHGSDATGSLRFPAALCGVVTLKPTRGQVPTIGAAGSPDPLRLWTQFVLARHVGDLAAVLDLITPGRPRPAAGTGDRLRCGLVTTDPIIGLDVHPACRAAVEVVGEVLEEEGHHVEHSFPHAFTTLFPPWREAMAVAAPWVRAGQVEWVAARLGRPRRAGDLTEEVLAEAERGRAVPDADGRAALRAAAGAMAPVADWWRHGHDVLVTPVTLEPAWTIGENAPLRTGMYAAPFSFTGQPAVVVPAGSTDDGRPVGVQLVGPLGADRELLVLAGRLETTLDWRHRRPPDQP